MHARAWRVALALFAVALGVGGWFATLWSASDWWAGISFSTITLLLIAAAFRGRFASAERARDYWTGFALFGLIHLLTYQPKTECEMMTCSVIDRIGDQVLGADGPTQNPKKHLTTIGLMLDKIPAERAGGMLWIYLPFIRENSKLFGSLAFGAIGGFVACHLRRRSVRNVPSPRLAGCPLLGLIWLGLLGILVGATFVLHANPILLDLHADPSLLDDVDFLSRCPGSQAANYALYNIEFLAVLFAAVEIRFAVEGERAWWAGFALFGGAYFLTSATNLSGILPTGRLYDLFPWVYFRFVSASPMPTVQVGGLILVDQETTSFFQSGLTWSGLATFPLVAWLGTLVSRLARRLEAASTWPGRLNRFRVRSAIGRLMLVLVMIGIFLGAIRNPSPLWVLVEGNAIVGLFLFASLRAWFGPRSSRSWWWGFALVGAIDLLIGAKLDHQVYSPELTLTTWPIHGVVARLHRFEIERHYGRPVPYLPLFDTLDDPQMVVFNAYHESKPLVMMAISLPMGWIGASLAKWLDRRSRSGEFP